MNVWDRHDPKERLMMIAVAVIATQSPLTVPPIDFQETLMNVRRLGITPLITAVVLAAIATPTRADAPVSSSSNRIPATTAFDPGSLIFTLALDDESAKSPQEAKSFEKEVTIKVKLNYLLYLPEGYSQNDDKKYPLMLFLHGAGESGDNLDKVKMHGPPKIVESKKDFPFILISPQSPRMGWNVDTLNALLDDVIANYRVDKDRVYLTGLSMGGFGTWALATAHPERFAAIAPICGGGNSRDVSKLTSLPVWVFHGGKDNVVPLARSEEMVKALTDAGAKEVKFTVYPEAGHDSWTETYNNPALYDWFLAHKRGDNK